MTSGGNGAAAAARPRHLRTGRGGDGSSWRAQRLPVLLLFGGAALALVIGTVVAQSGAQPPPKVSGASSSPRGALSSTSVGVRSTTSTLAGSSSGRQSTTTLPLGAPKPCVPGDVTVTTSTDRSSYSPGDQVTVVTKLVSSVACELTLFPAGMYDCGESIVVDTWSGEQVFPTLGQSEQCGNLPQGLITPGSSEIATIVWNQRAMLPGGGTGQAAPGRYEAIGSWSWNSGSAGAPYQVAVDSAPFTIVP
jgi:hypothetical protein